MNPGCPVGSTENGAVMARLLVEEGDIVAVASAAGRVLRATEGTTISVLAANQSEPGVFYAASNRGIYCSTDAGITWEQLAVEWPERYHDQRVGALVVTDDGRA